MTNAKEDNSERGDGRADYKVGRVIEKYSLEGTDAELVNRWTREQDRDSLRDLADLMNCRILETAMEAADMAPLEGEVENVYRLLTDEGSRGMRTQAQKKLERDGIPVYELVEDFVTHQAIHTYLRKHHAASQTPQENDDPSDTAIRRLQSKTEAVTETTVDRLDNAGELSIADPNVLVSVRVVCRECGTTFKSGDIAHGGQCECFDSS
jgi:predicted Zn-ribbon and HTH transcriptional regulator